MTLAMMALGCDGVVSVASNVAPRPVAEMVRHALAGRWEKARELHFRYYALFRDLFIDTNPVPVKHALARMGLLEEVYRLPLCEMDAGLKAKLWATIEACGLAGREG
jgi:4-hydroxy-tetrahydrodipicolinate synthase